MPRTPTKVRRRLGRHLRDRDLTGPARDALREQAEALVADVKRRKKRIASDFYEMGQSLAKLSEPERYRALGYDSFEDLLQGRKLMGRMQAHKLVEVARAYPKPLALQLGIEKAYLLTRHVVATPAADVAADLARRNVRIGGTRVRDLTADELRAATRRVRTGGSAERESTVLRAAKKKARAIQRELRRRGAKQAVVRAELDGAGAALVVRLPVDQADVLVD